MLSATLTLPGGKSQVDFGKGPKKKKPCERFSGPPTWNLELVGAVLKKALTGLVFYDV